MNLISGKFYGYYSAKGAETGGIIMWLTPPTFIHPFGKEVYVTAVYKSKEIAEKEYKWNDKICIGIVAKCVKRISYGTLGRSGVSTYRSRKI